MKFELCKIDWSAIAAIASVIMIIVTIIVLYKQLNQNHQENQENRLIQIKTTQHQVEMQHLNIFRDVANECVHLFSLNKYIQAAKLLQTDVDAARQIIDNGYAESLLTISHYNLASKNNNEKMDDSLNIGISEMGILLEPTFNIYWNNGSKKYEPDFVVETSTCIYLLETKAAKDIAAEDVIAKKIAAEEYCKHATEYTVSNGGKPWKYKVITHDNVDRTHDLAYILSKN